MATRWRRWTIRRRLAGLLEPGERLVVIERLGLGDWWALTDRAVYVTKRQEDSTRLLLSQIRTAEWTPRRTGFTIRTTADNLILVNALDKSALAERLQRR